MNTAPNAASAHPTTGRVSFARQSRRSSLLSMTTTRTSSLGLGISASGGTERAEARGANPRSERAADHAERPRQVEELETVRRGAAEQWVDDLLDEVVVRGRWRVG